MKSKTICHTHPAVQAGCALCGSSKAGNPQEWLLKLSDSGESQPAKAKDYINSLGWIEILNGFFHQILTSLGWLEMFKRFVFPRVWFRD